MFMSREPIPTNKRDIAEGPWLKQICIIPYTREYLLEFNAMEQTALEIAQSIDLNRCLENGHVVQMAYSPDIAVSVDNPADRDIAEEFMGKDALISKYLDNAKAKATA